MCMPPITASGTPTQTARGHAMPGAGRSWPPPSRCSRERPSWWARAGGRWPGRTRLGLYGGVQPNLREGARGAGREWHRRPPRAPSAPRPPRIPHQRQHPRRHLFSPGRPVQVLGSPHGPHLAIQGGDQVSLPREVNSYRVTGDALDRQGDQTGTSASGRARAGCGSGRERAAMCTPPSTMAGIRMPPSCASCREITSRPPRFSFSRPSSNTWATGRHSWRAAWSKTAPCPTPLPDHPVGGRRAGRLDGARGPLSPLG